MLAATDTPLWLGLATLGIAGLALVVSAWNAATSHRALRRNRPHVVLEAWATRGGLQLQLTNAGQQPVTITRAGFITNFWRDPQGPDFQAAVGGGSGRGPVRLDPGASEIVDMDMTGRTLAIHLDRPLLPFARSGDGRRWYAESAEPYFRHLHDRGFRFAAVVDDAYLDPAKAPRVARVRSAA